MANPIDILMQAVQQNSTLPDSNADTAIPAVSQAMQNNQEMSDADFQTYYNSIKPVQAPAPIEVKTLSADERTQNKQNNIMAAAAAKQKALTPSTLSPQQYFENAVGAATGKGAESATPLELDLRFLSPLEVRQKYGEQAGELIAGQARGQRDLTQANTRGQRTATELWDDFNVNVAGGLGATIGGVAALGAGLVNDQAGVGAAGLLNDFTKFMDSSQSGRLQDRKTVSEAKNALDIRDNAAQMVKDTATDGELVAGLKRTGRDVIDSLSNATDDSAVVGSGISNALGSFIGVGPVAKGLSVASKGVLGTTAAIGATEAGGSYAQSAQDIMERSHDELMKGSQLYRTLISQGESQDDAKSAVANSTALTSAAITAPVAIAAGRLVSKFEGNPLGVGSGRVLAGNIARETAEESIQSGAGQLAQNVADQQIANKDASLSEGVGRQIAEGGLYGMGMTAALGSPSVARDATVATGRKIAQVVGDRLAGIQEANEQASPVADATVAQAAAEAQASAPEAEQVLRTAVDTSTATPEAKAEATSYVDSLMSANNYTPDEAPAQFAGYMGDVTNRVGAIQRMAEIVNSADEGSPDQLRAGFYLNELVQDYTNTINKDPEALTALPDDHQAKKIVAQYQGLMGAITSTPKVMTAIDTVMTAIEKSEARKANVTTESLATPEGQQEVQDVLSTAELAPEKIDLGTSEAILKQIEQGNLTVSPRQKAALDVSVALLRGKQEADKAAVANGSSDPVSLNISSVDGEKGKSLTQHAKGIMAAYKSGDMELAADRLTDLRNFAQGLGNKVDALNSHYAAGNPNGTGLNYQVFVGGEPVTSKAKVAVRSGNESSVKFAQKVAGEAGLLANVYNGLATAFPELGAKALPVTQLAPELNGPAADVVARVRAAKTAPVVTVPAPVAEKASVAQKAPLKTEPVSVSTESTVKQDMQDIAKMPYLERLRKIEDLLNNPAMSDIVEGSKELEDQAANLVADRNAFLKAYQAIRSQISRLASPELIKRLDNKFKELHSFPKQAIDSGHTQERIKLLDWATRLRDAQNSKQGDLLASATPVAEKAPVKDKPLVDTDRIAKMDDAALNARMNKLQDLVSPSFVEEAEFDAVDAELSRREDAAQAANEAEEQATEPKVTEPVAAVEPVVESTTVAKGTAALFPDLINGEDNQFNKAFKLPKNQTTRIIGSENPVTVVRDALKDSAAFTALLGSSPKGEFTSEIATAYQAYLGQVEDFVSALDDNLQEFLDENNLRERALSGKGVETFLDGKSLNIAEPVEGTLVYNPELAQASVLASLQWFLESPQIGGNQDAKDIADQLGMTEDTVSDAMVNALTEGMSVTEAKRSLAQKIRSYWGVSNEANGLIGYQEGIPEAMAAEMLRLLVKGKWLTETKVKLTEADGLPALPDNKANVKEFIRLIPSKIDPESPLHDFPSAIEQAVLLEPEEINFIGEDNLPKVATDQLRNPGVKNTAQQLEAIENEQKTPYFVNHVMAGFYSALGRDNVVKLFGAGKLDPSVMNVNHAKSMDGVNRSTVAAFDHLQMLLGQVANNGPLDQTPIHYAFNMTRVGRLQMLGKHNPQANKLVREAILPTFSTLDLSSETSQDYARFMLGVGQLMGVKVHKMFQSRSRAKAEAMLNGPLAPVVAELTTWANNVKVDDVLNPGTLDSSITDMLIDGFNQAGEALTPMSLHAVMEYARYKGAADKSAFRTAVYVEADGVTNGPINAMVLFTSGAFKGNWIRNIAKGGLFFNRPGETVNTNNESGDNQDLYQATTDELDNNLNYLRKSLLGNDLGTRQMNSMLHLMTEFMGGDLKYTDNGDGTSTLELKRGIAKNPLTITIYGSGAGGIAAKMTKQLVDAIYERMSQVAEAQAGGEKSLAIAMFGPQASSTADAQARFDRFVDAYYNLTNTQAGMKKDGSLFFSSKPSSRKPASLDPVKFTFDTDQILNIQSNLRHLFVAPMRDAISRTVGQELLDTAELLRQATQAQSIVLEHAFKTEIDAALNEKAKDPTWKKSDFLTRTDLAKIHKKLDHLSPLVQTEGQSFYIAGSENADVEMTQFARALDGSMRSPAFVAGPKDAGVSGIPFMNIGTGDGLMMQLISTMQDSITGTLKIFDGQNMPLDQMEKGAEQANNAVFQTWQGNPLAAVHSSFTKFMADADLTSLSDEASLALTKALFGLQEKTAAPADELIAAMQSVQSRLLDSQQQIEARHRVMDRVSISVDQMAAVGVPYTKTGDLPLVGTDPDALAEQMNVYYNAELAAIRKDTPTNKVDAGITSLATQHESGAYMLSGADLQNLPSALTADQAAVMNEVVSSLAAQDYKVVFGTSAEIAAYRNGEVPAGTQGFTDIGAKAVYLINPSTETLLHELVHAATFEAVNAHYEGQGDRVLGAAVTRIESLMEDFLAAGQELTQTSDSVNSAFNTVAAVISEYQSKGQQAEALNEFMAWTLTNPSLARVAQRTDASFLSKAKDAVVSFIKSLFNIKATAGKDVFSNLLFNSAIVMQKQPSLSERSATGMLFQNSIYGDNDRLSKINQAIDTTIKRYLDKENTPVPGVISESASVMTGIQNGYRVAESFMAQGFKMSAQEANTFRDIVMALSTEASIDANAMAGVQQLYSHVMKQLSIESFMTDPVANDPNDYAQAAAKFDVLSGKYLVTRDLAGRSSLLPAFLALATTNDQFRSILSEMTLPKSAPNKEGTVDALLENTGNTLMDKLSQRMQGTSKAKNVQQAIDLLNNRMADVINQRETYIDQMASKTGGLIDRSNDLVVQGMDKLSAQAMKFANRTQRNAAGRYERAAGGLAAGVAALINQQSAGAVAQAIMSSANRTRLWEPVHTLINDLVGRTDSNASVYDMIKVVRSMVNRTRQQYRENTPEVLAKRFSRELTANEKASLHRSMAKTDLASLGKDALQLARDSSAAIKLLEADLSKAQHWSRIQAKAKQLANFMNTGIPGRNLLRNSEAVARLFGENLKMGPLVDTAKLDRLITLYALEGLSQEDKDTLNILAQDEKEGMSFTLAYLNGQRAEEQRKSTGRAVFNQYKGYVPTIGNDGVSILVANDSEYAKLLAKSYQRIGDYEGSSLERGMSRGYYYIPVSARSTYEQGIMQNVHQTAGGVEASTGFSLAQTAGRITDAADVKKLARFLSRETGAEPMLPVYSETGNVIAFERSLDPQIMERTEGVQDLHKVIGIWRGRQVEEGFAQAFNDSLIEKLHAMYESDSRMNPNYKAEYVDLLAVTDPILKDAMKLMSYETGAKVESLFGDKFMVRKDMLNDVLGYRSASIGDAWTGNSRWSAGTQEAVRNIAVSAFGNAAYKTLITAERTIQNVVSDAKSLIVVKSVIVPIANLMSNMYQLIGRGVPVRSIAKAMPSKLAEVESYTKSQVRLIEAEAELRAATGDPRVERRLKTEIQAIRDDHKRMTIWPLIEAGEFSGIADAGLTRREVELTSGRMQAYMEQAAAKLPGWGSTLGRYALVTKDTALFQGLQKAVEYGDFLGKAVLYDDLVQRKGLSPAQALAQITEEFVNYDRLPGRFRGTLENLGLLWFYNFKIRSVKVALSMIRNNPVHALFATLAPAPDFFGTVGLPTADNMISKLADGTLSYSIGPGQGMHAAMLNPWVNLTQ